MATVAMIYAASICAVIVVIVLLVTKTPIWLVDDDPHFDGDVAREMDELREQTTVQPHQKKVA